MLSRKLKRQLKAVETIHDLDALHLPYKFISIAAFTNEKIEYDCQIPEDEILLALTFCVGKVGQTPLFMVMLRQADYLGVEPFNNLIKADTFFKKCVKELLRENKFISFNHKEYDARVDQILNILTS